MIVWLPLVRPISMNHWTNSSGKFCCSPADSIARAHCLFIVRCMPQWDLGTARTNKRKKYADTMVSENNDTVGFWFSIERQIECIHKSAGEQNFLPLLLLMPLWHNSIRGKVSPLCDAIVADCMVGSRKTGRFEFLPVIVWLLVDWRQLLLCIRMPLSRFGSFSLQMLHHAQLKWDHEHIEMPHQFQSLHSLIAMHTYRLVGGPSDRKNKTRNNIHDQQRTEFPLKNGNSFFWHINDDATMTLHCNCLQIFTDLLSLYRHRTDSNESTAL